VVVTRLWKPNRCRTWVLLIGDWNAAVAWVLAPAPPVGLLEAAMAGEIDALAHKDRCGRDAAAFLAPNDLNKVISRCALLVIPCALLAHHLMPCAIS
jgi:hypothetical protein